MRYSISSFRNSFNRNSVVKFLSCSKWTSMFTYYSSLFSNLKQNRYVKFYSFQSKFANHEKLIADQPKSILLSIYNIVCKHFGSEKFMPSFKCVLLQKNPQKWKAEISLCWPSQITEEGIALRKRSAEAIAAKKVIEWLHRENVLDEKNYPILYQTDDKKKLIQSWKLPHFINISSELEEKIKCLLKEYEEIKNTIENCEDKLPLQSLIIEDSIKRDSIEDSINFNINNNVPFLLESSHNLIDVITGEKLKDYEPEQLLSRSFEMYHQMKENENNIEYQRLKNRRDALPILAKKEEILSLIQDNQVIVLSGETGCGKTTQVPQYILEQYIMSYRGADCNIVMTQPRRIAATSIAAHIAKERYEKLGDTIGFHVRLNKQLPSKCGAVLVCTTGILLQRLQLNPLLKGISHVIVDEVHERSVQIDFLLILLKKILKENKDLKVILMSATINAELFSEYFNHCPILNVPGFTFPVKEYFLKDALKLIGKNNFKIEEGPEVNVNVDLIVELIKRIDETKPPGAILCFLPGWQEIKLVNNKLQNVLSDKLQYHIHTLHSLIPHNQQSEVFNSVPSNVRKIILATNIAETSLTINDVVYVIDTGCHRELNYNPNNGLSILSTQWISKANVRQRKGRAGRVQCGECYHLFTEDIMNDMPDFPKPEMMRISLENLIIDSKIYNPNISALEFLSEAVQAPNIESIKCSINDLQQMNILNENENLTILGKYASHFALHPRLSKAIIYSALFRCINPVLTIAAMLTGKNPFNVNLEDNAAIREIRKKYDTNCFSDHLSFVNLYNDWNASQTRQQDLEFCEMNKINIQNMNFIKGLKNLFSENLHETGLIESEITNNNQYSLNSGIVLSVLCAALYPKVIKQRVGTLDRGRINWTKTSLYTLRGKKANLTSSSLLHKINQWPSPWLIYFSGVQAEERGRLTVRDASVISSISLILFAGKHLNMLNQVNKHELVTLSVNGSKGCLFQLHPSQGQCLMDLRQCFDNVIHWLLCNSNDLSGDEKVESFVNHFLEVLNQLLLQKDKDQSEHCDSE
ncbi:putative ATP-dependent RNA helicase DHX30 isoform X2 [Centruroides sculpturatus]|uniref:putative ATP-dependent RNA helicase DHX30 isoform X2 n=1 Tax=Centruroides sculpturatus TaxID=218467 RepID=UPI000C6DF307|nr:putative ATP-dependent RNA helicase DHX30 isoform X2 [Centruroides sculpturatus]